MTTTAYCVKCKAKREMVGAKQTVLNGKTRMRAMSGTCSRCGTKMFKILGKA